MAVIRLEEQIGYKDWLKNTNSSWQHDASMQATSDENPFIYLTNTGGDDAVFQIALSKLVDIQLIRKNSILVTPSVLDKAKGIKVELRDQSQNILATSKVSLNSKTWIHLLVNAENIALDITELWVTFVLPAGASTVIGGIQGQILTQDQTVVDSIKVEATDQDTAIDLTQAKLNASKYFVKFAPESWWRADGVLKAKQLLTVDPLDITVNVAEAMDKTFYVDTVNGDDNNDGSESAPFKTLQKAVDSVPSGGHGEVILKSDIIVSDIGKIPLNDSGKLILIHGYNTETPDNRRTMQFKIKPLDSYNTVYGFSYCGGYVFGLHYVNIEFIDESDPELNFDTFGQCFDYHSITGGGFALFLEKSKIAIPDNKYVNLVQSHGAGIGTVMVNVYNSEINTVGTNSYPFKINGSTFVYNVFTITFSGAKTNHSDLFSGIIKDANGVPRNIISNIVF